jgi:chromosome segregation ATPase
LEARFNDKCHEVSRLNDVIKRTQKDAEQVQDYLQLQLDRAEDERLDALAHKLKRSQREAAKFENELKSARQQADTHQAPLHSTTSKRRSRSRDRHRCRA